MDLVFARAIREEFSVDLGDLKVIIIGAGGGAGRAIATQCAIENCPQVILANRTLEKLHLMKDQLSKLIDREDLKGPAGTGLKSSSLADPSLEQAIGVQRIDHQHNLGWSQGYRSVTLSIPLGRTSSSNLRYHLQSGAHQTPQRFPGPRRTGSQWSFHCLFTKELYRSSIG